MKEALQAYQDRKLVAVPTETVYGLAAPIDDPELIEKIFTLKQRPKTSALSIQISSIEMAKPWTSYWSPLATTLAQKFWPGPLTLVLPAVDHISPVITANTGFIGLRCPDQPLTLELIRNLQKPIAVPSANPHGAPSPTTAEHVRSYFSEDDVWILDGGPCTVGTESTIVKIDQQDNIQFLRIGALTEKEITDLLGTRTSGTCPL